MKLPIAVSFRKNSLPGVKCINLGSEVNADVHMNPMTKSECSSAIFTVAVEMKKIEEYEKTI